MTANSTPALGASGLYVVIGGMPILRDVALRVDSGEAVAIMGGNGSGKSTLVRTVVGLLPFQEGQVTLFGTPLASFTAWSRIGYVPQHTSLNVTNATVREVVALGRLAHRRPFQWLRSSDKKSIDQALEQVGLTDRASWPFTSLSGGQRQRALIARALTSNPELLIMDEPFAGVDLHSQDDLAALLTQLRNSGLGMAVVLHDLGPLAPLLDRAITLCDGRLVDTHSKTIPGCPQPPPPSPLGLADPVSEARS